MSCPYCGRDFSGTTATCPHCRESVVSLSTNDPQAVVMLHHQNAEIAGLRARVAALEAAIREHRKAVHKTQIQSLGCIAPADCDDVLWAHVAKDHD